MEGRWPLRLISVMIRFLAALSFQPSSIGSLSTLLKVPLRNFPLQRIEAIGIITHWLTGAEVIGYVTSGYSMLEIKLKK